MSIERTALEILLKVTGEDAYLNLAVNEGLKSIPTESRARLTALVYCAVEHMGYSDFLITHYARGRLHSSIRGILRLSLAEMFFMKAPAHAVCSRAVSLAEEIGKASLKGYVNAVLRSVARDKAADKLPKLPEDPQERLHIISGMPGFVISEYLHRFGEAFTEELLTPRVLGTSLRAVTPFSTGELLAYASGKGLDAHRSEITKNAVVVYGLKGNLTEDELFKRGMFTVQSESAMLACEILKPEKGMRVLDACAAPGGKTAYLFDLMDREGYLEAWDIHPHRTELINKTLSRLGISGVCVKCRDASVYQEELVESFDRILIDAPCSGLGGGSKPDARMRRTEESIIELAEIQSRILSVCSRFLKRGGLLVYSTCTVSYRENERVVTEFIHSNEEYELVRFDALLPERLRERASKGTLQLFPSVDGTEGFFTALIRRRI